MKKLIFQLLLVIVIGLTVNTILGLFWGNGDIVREIGRPSVLIAGIGFAAYFAGMYLIETLRLVLILRTFKIRLPFGVMFRNSVMGYFYSSITPMAAGGQPFQILHLKSHNVQPSLASNIYINRYVEHLVFSVLVIVGSFGFTFGLLERMQAGSGLGVLVGGLSLSLGLAVLVSVGLIRPTIFSGVFHFFRRFPRLEAWGNKAVEYLNNVQKSITTSWNHHIALMLADTALGIVNTTLQALSLWLTLCLLGQRLDFPTVFLAYMILNLLVFYIPTPGASGGIEGVYSLAFGTLSRDYSGVWSAVLLWRIGAYYLHLPLGLLMLLSSRDTRGFLLGRT